MSDPGDWDRAFDREIWKRISRIDRRDQAGAENAASDRDPDRHGTGRKKRFYHVLCQ